MKFLTKKGNSPKNIHEKMVVVFEKSKPLYSQDKYLRKQFKWDRASIHDESKYGRLLEAWTEGIINKHENSVKISIIDNGIDR